MEKSLELKFLDNRLTVCKVEKGTMLDYTDGLFFIGNTDEELSVVCETEKTPADTIEREDGWTAFRVEGVLDFSLTGILSKLTTVLAEKEIGVFAVSTYNTDYVLIKEKDRQAAEKALADAGYTIV
ncbi:MAG: ACT domain-containing protein [Firmicutes bacterium]|nr:ACT domain-containing protein [Bacillota bacterium]